MPAAEKKSWSALVLTWLPVICSLGSLCLFVFYGRRLQESQITVGQVEARVKTVTEPYVTKMTQLETEIRAIQKDREVAEAIRSTAAASSDIASRLEVTPRLARANSVKGVSDVKVEFSLKNIGTAPVEIKNFEMAVLLGTVTPEVKTVIDKTNVLFDVQTQIEDAFDEQKKDALRAQWEGLHQDCPHGQLFAVDELGKHVKWQEVADLKTLRKVDLSLEAGESSSVLFTYVLTENTYHHGSWYRFRLTVGTGEKVKPSYELVLATGQDDDNDNIYGKEAGVRVVEETKTSTWQPLSPIPSVSPASEPSEE